MLWLGSSLANIARILDSNFPFRLVVPSKLTSPLIALTECSTL
jgi:hypothetical protein